VVSLRRAARPLEHACVQGWADIRVRRALHPNLSLAPPHDRYEYATSRAGSEVSFKPENEVFLLMFDRAHEPSRGGAGTWQRQVQSKAAPQPRRVRVQHESTRRGAMARTNMPASPTRWSDGPASQARHHGPRTGPSIKRIIWLSGPASKERRYPRACPKAVPKSK